MVRRVTNRRLSVCSIREGLAGQWLRDCGSDLGEDALTEFFLLRHILATITLDPDREDVLVWRWSGDGCYSCKSTYEAFFADSKTRTS
jgi:hypothetical protein